MSNLRTIMKILAIGDFHGEFPEKLKRLAKSVDIILSTGDYAGIREFRPLIHKMLRLRARGIQMDIELLAGKDYERLQEKDYSEGKRVLEQLNKLGIVFSVFGNNDWYESSSKKEKRDYGNVVKKLKNVQNINRSQENIENFKIMGFGGYIDNDVYFTKKGGFTRDDSDKKRKKRYAKEKARFLKAIKTNPDILLLHYNPYGCLDKMKAKGFPLTGSHMGIGFFNQGIKQHKPLLVICGHMHENQGICKIGNSTIVNPGAALEGKAAIIDIENKKIKSVRFVK